MSQPLNSAPLSKMSHRTRLNKSSHSTNFQNFPKISPQRNKTIRKIFLVIVWLHIFNRCHTRNVRLHGSSPPRAVQMCNWAFCCPFWGPWSPSLSQSSSDITVSAPMIVICGSHFIKSSLSLMWAIRYR